MLYGSRRIKYKLATKSHLLNRLWICQIDFYTFLKLRGPDEGSRTMIIRSAINLHILRKLLYCFNCTALLHYVLFAVRCCFLMLSVVSWLQHGWSAQDKFPTLRDNDVYLESWIKVSSQMHPVPTGSSGRQNQTELKPQRLKGSAGKWLGSYSRAWTVMAL